MATAAQTIEWEALEHFHTEKSNDWYWALGIIAISAAALAIFYGNILFAIVIGLGAFLMAIVSLREPNVVSFAITPRGVRVDDRMHPFATLSSFCIDDEHPHGPHLLLKSTGYFSTLLVIPIPPEEVERIDDALATRLPEEHMEESIAHHILEFFGF